MTIVNVFHSIGPRHHIDHGDQESEELFCGPGPSEELDLLYFTPHLKTNVAWMAQLQIQKSEAEALQPHEIVIIGFL